MTTTMPTHRSSATVDGVEITRKRDTRGALLTVVTWILALGFFFPVLWMVLTAFKKESEAATDPPTFIFTPTLEQFREVFDAGIGTPLLNSLFATILSTILVLLLGVPAAFALSLAGLSLPWRAEASPLHLRVSELRSLDGSATGKIRGAASTRQVAAA